MTASRTPRCQGRMGICPNLALLMFRDAQDDWPIRLCMSCAQGGERDRRRRVEQGRYLLDQQEDDLCSLRAAMAAAGIPTVDSAERVPTRS